MSTRKGSLLYGFQRRVSLWSHAELVPKYERVVCECAHANIGWGSCESDLQQCLAPSSPSRFGLVFVSSAEALP